MQQLPLTCQYLHEKGIPLIVDEAHGAHFEFSEEFPESAVKAGADIVINSIHKTLPALTQTALLHISGNYVDYDKVERFWNNRLCIPVIFNTFSNLF